MQDRHLCWTPYIFLGSAVPLNFFILESPLFDRVNHSISIFITTKITMQERHLCWPPYFFPWPRSGLPNFFNSTIATVHNCKNIRLRVKTRLQTHSSLRQSNLQLQHEAAQMSRGIRAVEHRK